DLQPNLHVGVVGGPPALGERPADLLQRALDRDALRDAVGADLDALAADVSDELHELAALLDVALHHLLVGAVELADGAAAPDFDAGVVETLADLLAGGGV